MKVELWPFSGFWHLMTSGDLWTTMSKLRQERHFLYIIWLLNVKFKIWFLKTSNLKCDPGLIIYKMLIHLKIIIIGINDWNLFYIIIISTNFDVWAEYFRKEAIFVANTRCPEPGWDFWNGSPQGIMVSG